MELEPAMSLLRESLRSPRESFASTEIGLWRASLCTEESMKKTILRRKCADDQISVVSSREEDNQDPQNEGESIHVDCDLETVDAEKDESIFANGDHYLQPSKDSDRPTDISPNRSENEIEAGVTTESDAELIKVYERRAQEDRKERSA